MQVQSISRVLIPLVVVACAAAPVLAQEWGAKMFDRHEVKFGSVARFADTTFKFKVTNPFVEDIQITNLSTSCGCISWTDRQFPITIKSKEVRELTIRLDTVGHQGDKRVRAYVSLLEPTRGSSSSLTIPVEGRIRSDFEVRPSYVGFGPIDLGKGYTQKIGINYVGGHPNWRIVAAKTTSPHYSAKVVETGRAGGTASYEAIVEIDARAPVGVLRDQLILTTNEGGDSTISIPIEAKVEPDIVVTDVQFGTLAPGQAKSTNVVVRGKKPFKIEKVDHIVREVRARPTEDGTVPGAGTVAMADNIEVKVPESAAAVQLLMLTVTPPADAGMFEEEFAIQIAGRSQPVTFKARGRVQPPEVTEIPK